ncbi:protein RALF-like 27 [Melia azedarach]|uniref:Protein RALF-like 27 n=1 Tax=Melia azedarach TaxID=155640 RepID=A0ACC1X7X9_MELAZ|nr:protein RALF-like 27 [Melia azedarach]
MGTEINRRCLRFCLAIFLLMILFGPRLSRAAIDMDISFNNVSAADFIGEVEEEFLMDSEVNHRLLAGAGGKPISYRSLERQGFCNAKIYGDCIKAINGDNRPCTYYNRCKRGEHV